MNNICCIQRVLPHAPCLRGFAKKFLIRIYDSISYYHKFLSSSLLNKFYLRKETYERLYSSNLDYIRILTSISKSKLSLSIYEIKTYIRLDIQIHIVNYFYKIYSNIKYLSSMKKLRKFRNTIQKSDSIFKLWALEVVF